MSEERPERSETRSSAYLSVTHDSTSQSEGQKLAAYMDNVYYRIAKKQPDVQIILVSKNQRFIKSSIPYSRAIFCAATLLNFTDKVRVLAKKIYPDEPIENVRIKGKKDEFFVVFDDLLEIIVIEKEKNKAGI